MIKKLCNLKLNKPEIGSLIEAYNLLPRKFHSQTVAILALTLIGTILEMAGIGLVIPAIAIMTDESTAYNYAIFILLFDALGNPSHAQLVIYGISLLLSAYIIKAFYLAFLSFKQAQYIYNIKVYISQSLFERYLRSPYEFHLQKNSGHLIRNITVEVEQLVSRVLIPGVLLITELTVIMAIAVLLFIIQPLGALLLFMVMGFAVFGFQRVTQNYLIKWGAERQRYEGDRIQKAQEGLGGIKDVKLMGRECNFIQSYGEGTLNAASVERKQYALSNIPRLWLETVGVFGLTLLVVITLDHTSAPSDLIPIIGLFAAAAFRILPSANRVLSSLQSLRYSDAVISLILEEFNLQQEENRAKNKLIRLDKKLEMRNVSYTYPNDQQNTLFNISLTINKGECIGIIGASGAGKSTLVDVLLGLIKPSSGGIFIDDLDINEGIRGWQDLIGYVQQSIFLTDDTLRSNIAFGLKCDQIDDKLIMQAIKAAQLDSFVQSLPQGANTLVGERGVRLSGGQRQRIGIARALYHNPPLLVFDEATSALDNETEAGVMESIKSFKGNRTVIIIAHRLSTIEHCDKIFRLEGGRISLLE